MVNLDRLGDKWFVDLDVDIIDAVVFKNLPTLLGHSNAITTGERSGNHLYPEDDRGR